MLSHFTKIKLSWPIRKRAIDRPDFRRWEPVARHLPRRLSWSAQIGQPFQVPTDTFELQFQPVDAHRRRAQLLSRRACAKSRWPRRVAHALRSGPDSNTPSRPSPSPRHPCRSTPGWRGFPWRVGDGGGSVPRFEAEPVLASGVGMAIPENLASQINACYTFGL